MKMKRTIVTIAVATFIAGTVFMSCNSSETKVKDARENVIVAKQELNQALQDSIQDFRLKSEVRFIEYEKQIVELKAKIAKEKSGNKSTYEKELAKLEQKNQELKNQLANFTDESQEKWDVFKTEFNKDMDNLGNAFKDLVTKNNK